MIDQQLLRDVAGYINGRISKVVLNDSYEITVFSVKKVTGTTVELQYLVPAGSVAEITKIDLRDSTDSLISTNAAYVPITTDTAITQIIDVREV